MSPLLSTVGFNINESFVGAEVNFMSDGTPSLACMTVCTLMPPFFLPVSGRTPHTLEQQAGEQSYRRCVYNLKPFHPFLSLSAPAVRGKHMAVSGV